MKRFKFKRLMSRLVKLLTFRRRTVVESPDPRIEALSVENATLKADRDRLQSELAGKDNALERYDARARDLEGQLARERQAAAARAKELEPFRLLREDEICRLLEAVKAEFEGVGQGPALSAYAGFVAGVRRVSADVDDQEWVMVNLDSVMKYVYSPPPSIALAWRQGMKDDVAYYGLLRLQLVLHRQLVAGGFQVISPREKDPYDKQCHNCSEKNLV